LAERWASIPKVVCFHKQKYYILTLLKLDDSSFTLTELIKQLNSFISKTCSIPLPYFYLESNQFAEGHRQRTGRIHQCHLFAALSMGTALTITGR
jgi:hypothetical protein